ncbi:N-acetylmuramoyl-L-alanine amidase [Caldanaerobius fijiensis DSM 17918]|uniref:N-acetylmuramoyl-L-alanine amidase n=1 Tax=Caldanaerobius fijiensis DSM 17918 TaxID=1121256 RepID=A0A1M5B7G0_9THEO|nr:N-acetylmuramoyl-L-alanine amidase [Caldanaerobius fijiensis]SHF38453.1 N-acetylmuramoyl-L-alanine amidase [Caldanaerobius fijiensis DSM 17918]
MFISYRTMTTALIIFFTLCIFPLSQLLKVQHVFARLQPLSGKVIVIDPGHGGIDGGCNRGGILEKNINLSVALTLRKKLENAGATVFMTRETDTALDHLNNKNPYRHKRDLIARVDIINQHKPDIFLSLHVNSGNSKSRGAIVFFSSKNPESKKLAQPIQDYLNELTGQVNTSLTGDFYILRNAASPGVLIEMGFISNPQEANLLQDKTYQSKLADAILSGVMYYFLN